MVAQGKNISNKVSMAKSTPILFQVHRNVLDVSFHVTQYQSIISDIKGEIGRLKEKINIDPVH